MSKTKSLLSFALAATMLFSTVFVGANAEDATPKTGTLEIGTATVEVGEPTATVDFTLTFDEAVKSPHSLCTIVSDYELTKLAVKSVDGTVVADDENLAEGDDDLVSSATVKISNNGLNLAAKKVIFESGVDSNAPVVTTIVFTATFDTSAAVAGTSVVSAEIDATNYDENTFALTVNDGEIVVAEPHVCSAGEVTDNEDGTHDIACAGCDKLFADNEACNYVDGACSVCGAADPDYVPEEPECEHEWDAGVVTTMPSVTEGGVKEFTCSACGETKTEDIAAFNLANHMTVNVSYNVDVPTVIGAIGYTREGCMELASYVANLGGEITDFGCLMNVDGTEPTGEEHFYKYSRVNSGKAYSWETMQVQGYKTTLGCQYVGLNFAQMKDTITFIGFIEFTIGEETYYYYGGLNSGIFYDYIATQSDEKSVALYTACNNIANTTASQTTFDSFTNSTYGIEYTASYNLVPAQVQFAPKFTRAGCMELAKYVRDTLGGEITDFGCLMNVDGTEPTGEEHFYKYSRINSGKAYSWDTMQGQGYNSTLGCQYVGLNIAQFASVIKFVAFVEYKDAEGNINYFYPDEVKTYVFNDMITNDTTDLGAEYREIYSLFYPVS